MRLLTKTINVTGKTHSASVFFFHGSGDTGTNLVEWVRSLTADEMAFPHVQVIFPTAPIQPYTPANGELSNVWFNRHSISIDAPESLKSLEAIYSPVRDLLNKEIQKGIPPSRIIVGGFSMGGALSLHIGYHLNTELAGIFACSSFLNRDSRVYESLREKAHTQQRLPELKMFHGDSDDVVPFKWGRQTYDELTQLGVKGDWHTLSNAEHELERSELMELKRWIQIKLPLG